MPAARRSCWAVLSILLAGTRAEPAASPSPPVLRLLAPAERGLLDQSALRLPPLALAQERRDLAGNVPAWLLSRVNLTPAEERDRAAALHKEIVARHRVVRGPSTLVAKKVLARLARELPAHLRPAAGLWELTVLDEPDYNAFAIGGGWLYVSRPLLEALLADRQRGEAGLAFVLAVQMGHVARQHCRRGWQRLAIEEEARKGIEISVAPKQWRAILETGVRPTGKLIEFLYSRDQQFEADLFALHLCRNAGLPLDAALDPLRRLALLREGAGRGHFVRDGPPPLRRLERLLRERDGLMDEEHGLFACDGGALKRCGPRSVGKIDRPIVFVHGLRGGNESFAAYLRAFASAPELRGRTLLVFRYPGNGSLARAGRFLASEMGRVMAAPERTAFVCHSAGGLVFRYYAEVLREGFEQAHLLGVPNQGSNLTALKFLVDVGAFVGDLPGGLTQAIALTVPEGRGQIAHDLHPDSLFLRHLGQDRRLAGRYHVYYGEYLSRGEALALEVAFAAWKRLVTGRWATRLMPPTLKRQALPRLPELRLPAEVLRGDLIVSSRSGGLRGAGRVTKTGLRHQALRSDEAVMRQVLAAIGGK